MAAETTAGDGRMIDIGTDKSIRAVTGVTLSVGGNVGRRFPRSRAAAVVTAAAGADHVQVIDVDATAEAVGAVTVLAVVAGVDMAARFTRCG